jgi:hypothetical protein
MTSRRSLQWPARYLIAAEFRGFVEFRENPKRFSLRNDIPFSFAG